MINMPYADIIERIKEENSITEADLDAKIKLKMDQLSGLISKEGAAYIVANDLGVKLVQTQGLVKIKNIVGEMKNVETAGKVLKIFDLVEFERDGKKGKVRNFLIADDTGQVKVAAWHDQTTLIDSFNEGDVIKLSGYVRVKGEQKEIHLNERSKIELNPSDIKITGVAEQSSTRKTIVELKENDQNSEIFGTVVQVYDPRYFEQCPTCRKKPIQREDGFMCEQHGTIKPEYGYVINAILDDGSDNIRIVMFRQQMQEFFKKTDEELMTFRTNIEKFEDMKTELLGEQIIVNGRVVKNSMFDRLELISNKITRDIDPELEIRKLEAHNEKDKIEKDLPSVNQL